MPGNSQADPRASTVTTTCRTSLILCRLPKQSRFTSNSPTLEYHRDSAIARRRLFRLRWNMETNALKLGSVCKHWC